MVELQKNVIHILLESCSIPMWLQEKKFFIVVEYVCKRLQRTVMLKKKCNDVSAGKKKKKIG